MSILKYKYCTKCGEKTYHRFVNRLRCAFVPMNGWHCTTCLQAQAKARDELDTLGGIPPHSA